MFNTFNMLLEQHGNDIIDFDDHESLFLTRLVRKLSMKLTVMQVHLQEQFLGVGNLQWL